MAGKATHSGLAPTKPLVGGCALHVGSIVRYRSRSRRGIYGSRRLLWLSRRNRKLRGYLLTIVVVGLYIGIIRIWRRCRRSRVCIRLEVSSGHCGRICCLRRRRMVVCIRDWVHSRILMLHLGRDSWRSSGYIKIMNSCVRICNGRCTLLRMMQSFIRHIGGRLCCYALAEPVNHASDNMCNGCFQFVPRPFLVS